MSKSNRFYRHNGKNYPIKRNKNGYPYFVADAGRRQYHHRIEAEKKMRRPLKSSEEVHHRDGNPSNYRRKNVEAVNKKAHREFHRAPEWKNAKAPSEKKQASEEFSRKERRVSTKLKRFFRR